MENKASPATPSTLATSATDTTDTSNDVETPSPPSHGGDLSAEVDRKELMSSVARVVSPPPMLSLLENVLDESIGKAGAFDTDNSKVDKYDEDDEISTEIRNLSKAFELVEATIDAELDAFIDMATLAESSGHHDDDNDNVSLISAHGTIEEAQLSEKERQELEEVEEVAMLLRQNSRRYAYAFASTTSGVSDPFIPPPLTPTRRAIASTLSSSPASHSSRSFDVMSNTRIHQRAVSRLKRQYCYLAATKNATALSDVGAAGSEGNSADSIAESELVANVLLLQAERMAKKVNRSYHGPASPKCTLSPLKGSRDLSPFSLHVSISPIRTVSTTADRSAAKASPEQLAAIEKCLREGEALTSGAKLPQTTQKDSGVAIAFAAPVPVPFLPTDDEMVGLSDEQKQSRFAPRFALPYPNSPTIKCTISENREEGDGEDENEVSDTLSPLPPSSLAKSDRWAKYKKKGTKGRNAASSFKSLGGITNSNCLQAQRPQFPDQHFSIFQHNLVSMKEEEAKKKALREKKEQLIEDARNKKLYNSFVMLKAASATKSGDADTVNGSWLKEGRWFIDFETFDTSSDEEIQGDERGPGIEAPTQKLAATLIGGFRKHIVRGRHFHVSKRIVSRRAMAQNNMLRIGRSAPH